MLMFLEILGSLGVFLYAMKILGGHGYLSYLSFLIIGIVLTLIVQSSSAAMAITVTFAINGWIGFEESAFIVLGENIGTTVTAWLAALGANHNAKRAARAHFLFNVLGVLWMLLLFPFFAQAVEWLAFGLPDSLRTAKHDSDIGFKLAIFHTTFNFCNICLLVGFIPWMEKVVHLWVSERPGHRFEILPRARTAVGIQVTVAVFPKPRALLQLLRHQFTAIAAARSQFARRQKRTRPQRLPGQRLIPGNSFSPASSLSRSKSAMPAPPLAKPNRKVATHTTGS